MGSSKGSDLTELLAQFRRGKQEAAERLIPLIYDELHRLAVRYMRRERPDHSLQPTALINEAYLRLFKQRSGSWKNRAHFFAAAAMLMREILVDHARRRNAAKRGEGAPHLRLDDSAVHPASDPGQRADVIALDQALTRLAVTEPRQARIVTLRFFAEMSTKEVAEALDISARTVEREWKAAKAWLAGQLLPLA